MGSRSAPEAARLELLTKLCGRILMKRKAAATYVWCMSRSSVVVSFTVLLVALSVCSSASAVFPGRNGLIAYSACRLAPVGPGCTGHESLMTVSFTGGTPKRIGDGIEAQWSSDGRELASITFRLDSSRPGGLLLSTANGRSSRSVTLRGMGTSPGVALPAWFPGRRELYFFGYQAAPRRGWFRGTLTKSASIRAKRIGKIGGALSPDGKHIAFAEYQGKGASAPTMLYVARLDGTTGRRVVANLGPASEGVMPARIDWSADGRRLVLDGGLGISVANVDGSGLRRLISGQAVAHPAWSPDGSRIVFVRIDGAITEASRTNRLVTVKPDGTDLRVVLTNRRGVDWPDWQPLPKTR